MDIFEIRHSREHTRRHAQKLNTCVRGFHYRAGCEICPTTMLHTAALLSNLSRSLAAYGAAKLTAQRLVRLQPRRQFLAGNGQGLSVHAKMQVRSRGWLGAEELVQPHDASVYSNSDHC